jgi:hypothetical protein
MVESAPNPLRWRDVAVAPLMTEDRLPSVVRSFIATHIRSLQDLHLLIGMACAPDRWWDEDTAVRELGFDRRAARAGLEHLAAHNLLEIRVTDDVRYQYRPGTADLEAAVAAAVDTYRSNPVALWRLAPSPRERRIRDFADAFKVKRDEPR